MREKLRQLFGGDQKQDKTKEVAEQKEQKVREEQEEENIDDDVVIEENDEGWDDDYEWDGDGWSRKPYKEKAEGAYEYTARDYEELKIKLHEAEDEITDLEGQIHDLIVECRQVDKLLTQTHMELKNETKKRKKSDETARAAQRAVSELEQIKIILNTENAAEAVQGLVEELKSKNAENKRQSGKIAHLSRIMYERANADRDLRPKRQHTGYAVISSTQKEIKGKKVWETLLSLPCPASLEVQFVNEIIRKEFFSEEGLIRNIGITDIYEGNYDSMRSEMRNRRKNPDEINVALSYKLRQNFRGKYWEAIITHTKPLSKIPDDMMLQNDKQKEEKGKKKKKQKQEEKKEVEANQ